MPGPNQHLRKSSLRKTDVGGANTPRHLHISGSINQNHPRSRCVMPVFHAGTSHRCRAFSGALASRTNRGNHAPQILQRDRSLAQDHRHPRRAIHDRGLKTHCGRSTLENAIDATAQFVSHRTPCRRARAAGSISGWRRHRRVARAQEFCRNRVSRETNAHRIKSGADQGRYIRVAWYHHGQRSRKKMRHQLPRRSRNVSGHTADLIE